MKLTAAMVKRRAFAEYVAQGLNATQAYMRAGYKATGHAATVEGSKFLMKPDVQAYLAEAQAKISKGRILSATERRELLTRWARAEDEPADLRDRIASVKELNAMDGLHVKKLEHSGPNGQPIGAVLATVDEATLRQRLAELAARKPIKDKK